MSVDSARETALPRADAELVASRLALLCEPTRLQTLQALHEVRELCVGDLALALGVSEDAASYAVRQLRRAGVVSGRREGRVVFYALASRFPAALLAQCLRLGEFAPAEGDGS